MNWSLKRFLNKKDVHTQKVIDIIGRKKYKKLLEEGIVFESYEIRILNQKEHANRVKKLKDAIVVLSSMISQRGVQL